jgi:hypothetical protein
MISSWDDFPVHQTSLPIRHVATSDRNFYDRYYFNLHGSSDELFMVMGLGQYPNLGTTDAFACVQRGDTYRVVRASRELGDDRMDTSVGPFRVEIVKPLEEVRFILDETEHGIAADLRWTGAIPAVEEQPQFIRRHGRVMFDTSRFAQTGCWEGTLRVGSEDFQVTPDRWWGTRDRSWGVRPHGEREPAGIHENTGSMSGMWNYFPMQFDDHSILYINNEENDGSHALYDARRIWNDPERPIEDLGPVEYDHQLTPGTRMMTGSVVRFPLAPSGPIEITCEPLCHAFIAIGTGYGVEDDWRHGMYQGALEVQGLEYKTADIAPIGQFTIVDHVGRYTYSQNGTDHEGYGLYEHAFIGAFDKFGMTAGSGAGEA